MVIDPDEIFLDAYNLPDFDRQQFEGELERPIEKSLLSILLLVFGLVLAVFLVRSYQLQIVQGETLAARSAGNTLRHRLIFPERGVIYDRRGSELAWNNPERVYAAENGLAHLLGYLGYPDQKDLELYDFSPQALVGQDGVERVYNQRLAGTSGVLIEEADAYDKIHSSYFLRPPAAGENLFLSIDARVQNKLFELIKQTASARGFQAGAGVILDVQTGELLALVSYPEYDPSTIKLLFSDPAKPLLNRAVAGLYSPGSIIKPIIAVGVLNEGVIDPAKEITSTGEITLVNPYDPSRSSIFRDWRAHGAVDLRRALAVSSNIYFYEVGGGFGDQPGLGIDRIDYYARLFGLGQSTGINWPAEEFGTIPTPAWKEVFFPGDPWRIGDTYHTAIGQYGFQVTPLQMARAAAAIGNGGRLVTPTVLASSSAVVAPRPRPLGQTVKPEVFPIVREGMRLAVTAGTGVGLNLSYLEVAAKTGTAELGTTKEAVTSWVIGFFPYEKPRYSFAVTLERGRRENTIGAVSVMRQLLDWLHTAAPEYLGGSSTD